MIWIGFLKFSHIYNILKTLCSSNVAYRSIATTWIDISNWALYKHQNRDTLIEQSDRDTVIQQSKLQYYSSIVANYHKIIVIGGKLASWLANSQTSYSRPIKWLCMAIKTIQCWISYYIGWSDWSLCTVATSVRVTYNVWIKALFGGNKAPLPT